MTLSFLPDHFPVFIETDNPDIFSFQCVNCLCEIRTRDAQMLACARRGVDDGRRDLDRMCQWDDHTVYADHFRRAKESSKVLWVIERIKHQDESRFILLRSMIKNFN